MDPQAKPNYTAAFSVLIAVFFLLLAITGLLLSVYYKPTPELAYNSVTDIVTVVPLGRLVRNIHGWCVNAIVVTAFLHLARVFYTASYRPPWGVNWALSILILVTIMGLGFSGYILPWDQNGYWGATIGSNIAFSPRELTDALGLTKIFDLGGFQKNLLLGANALGADALIRFHVLHVMFLPVVLFTLLFFHFWRLRKQGALDFSRWPTFLMAGLALILFLSLFFDVPLKEIANPAVPDNPSKAPWYFVGLQELVSYSAFMGGFVIPTVTLGGLLFIPYFDREKGESGRWFPGPGEKGVALQSLLLALVLIVSVLACAVHFGWLRQWFPNIPQIVITLVNPGTIYLTVLTLWSLSFLKRRKSTRLSAVAVFTCFLTGYVLLTYFGNVHRGPNWGFYWWPSLWPVH